ncbi:phage protease [Streptosporangium sp. V21-05]|uniref:phage protease n=1 Tax=Streptosporangium sp. V21-05 TaxID=3446115 RepID=UPI003F537C54
MPNLAVPDLPALATIPGVELVQAGQWDISTGRVTFAPADLASAVGALDCPAVRRPVLKLGHTDPRFDGEPAIGWIDNMGLVDSGNTLIGDYASMPGWLAAALPSAYPDRSIEGVFDFKCQLGHTHPFVLTAVALLGVTAPGVGTLQSLQDIAALYGVAASSTGQPGHAVSVHCKGAPMPNPRPAEVAAGVTTEDVRRAYYDAAPWSVWITELQVEPPQLITMDDETGKRYRVPVVVDGDDVTFGDAVEVRVEYVDKGDSTPVAASSAVVFASRAESRPEASTPLPPPAQPAEPTPATPADPAAPPIVVPPAPEIIPTPPQTPPVEPAAGPTPTEGEATMPALDEGLRERLGLGADADEATILAAVDEALNERAEPTIPVEPVAAAPAPLPEGTVVIEEAVLNELREQASQGVAARTRQLTEDRDRAIEDAIRAGKTAPARRDHWQKSWAADPDGTRDVLASLAPGLVPLADIGEPGGEPAGGSDIDADIDSLFSTPGRSA